MGFWATARRLLSEIPGSQVEQDRAQQVATLSMRMGGLGLRSASRCSPAACLASWADALPMIAKRNLVIAETMEHAMQDHNVPERGCLSELYRATTQRDGQGFEWRPTWSSVLPRTFPKEPVSGNTPGSIGLLPSPTPVSGIFPCCQAKLPRTGHTFTPTQVATPVLRWHTPPQLLSTPFRRTCSVFCSLPVTEATCGGYHAPSDPPGVHRAARTRSGRVRKRATLIERTLAPVFR